MKLDGISQTYYYHSSLPVGQFVSWDSSIAYIPLQLLRFIMVDTPFIFSVSISVVTFGK